MLTRYFWSSLLILFITTNCFASQYTTGTHEVEGALIVHDTATEEGVIVVDISNHRVGINEDDPTVALDIVGSIKGSSGIALKYASKTSVYTILASDYTVNNSGTYTITLPTTTGVMGVIYNIKNSGSGTITVDASGSELIDGDYTVNLFEQEVITIQSSGSEWFIL